MTPAKSILVTGDTVIDWNIVDSKRQPSRHSDLGRSVEARWEAGGAWFLRKVIDDVLESDRAGVDVMPAAPAANASQKMEAYPKASASARAWQVWAPFRKNADDGKAGVWRIEKFHGCETNPNHAIDPEVRKRAARPDILVIDNLGLGFEDNIDLWPWFLKADGKAKRPSAVIVKCSRINRRGALWQKLERTGLIERTTFVLSATALRERGALLSMGLSWDKTIETAVEEFESGMSAGDFARARRVVILFGCEGVATFSRVGGAFKKQTPPERLTFERFLYEPNTCEGAFRATRPGAVFGGTSLVTAALVGHETAPERLPLFPALGRALAAVRHTFEEGAGEAKVKTFNTEFADEGVRRIFHPAGKDPEAAKAFASAWPEYTKEFPYGVPLSDDWQGRRRQRNRCDLLRDFTGEEFDYVLAKAVEIVREGPEKALARVPKARYGKYLTADREEIERVNAVSVLIDNYLKSGKRKKPLSIAVFGPPGSGKSFAVKQLLASISGDCETLEFNLGEFGDSADLASALHQVHDLSLRGKTPVVFWDEFDSGDCKWLSSFLAPMQDGVFREGAVLHPVSDAIFFFAGGVYHSFQDFSRKCLENETNAKTSANGRNVKGPDFISRLHGFVNVKGPDPMGPAEAPDERKNEDIAYLVRRAILLRADLEKRMTRIIDPETKIANICPGLLHAFLLVDRYKHGARSLGSLVAACRTGLTPRFGLSDLPSGETLALHVSDDFLPLAHAAALFEPIVEPLARACHEAWREQKIKNLGETEKRPRHYDALDTEEEKENDRKTARLTQAKFSKLGYEIKPAGLAGKEGVSAVEVVEDKKTRKQLMEAEHDIWMRDRLIRGFQFVKADEKDGGGNGADERDVMDLKGEKDDEYLREHFLNPDIALFRDVRKEHQNYDNAIIESAGATLEEEGYVLTKKTETSRPPARRRRASPQ